MSLPKNYKNSMFSEKKVIQAFLYILLVLSLNGCIMDDMSGCSQYELTVKAVTSDGEDISLDSFHSLGVYLFADSSFVKVLYPDENGKYLLGYDKGVSLTFVAWGNLSSDSIIPPVLKIGTNIKDALVQLKKNGEYSYSSPELFYASQTISSSSTRSLDVESDTVSLLLKRKVGALTIMTKNLELYFGKSDNYRYVIRETKNTLNFLGELTGEEANYSPYSYFDENRILTAPAFNVFPSETDGQIEVDIYRGDTKVYATTTDSSGNPIKVLPGKQSNIYISIEFCDITLQYIVSPWGVVGQNVEF